MLLNFLKILVSLIFFVFYYIVFEFILHISIFEYPYSILTIYFVFASLTFTYAERHIYDYLMNHSKLFIPPANVLMSVVYLVSPIYTVGHMGYTQFKKLRGDTQN